MKYLHVFTLLTVVTLAGSDARAQYGLYGSPEMLRLPQPEAWGEPQAGYPNMPYASPSYAGMSPAFDVPAGPGPFAAAPAIQPGPAVGRYPPPARGIHGQMTRTAAGIPMKPVPEQIPLPTQDPPGLELPNQYAPSVVDQMLEEADRYEEVPSRSPNGGCTCGAFGEAVGEPWSGDCDPCVPRFESRWFASVAGLMMTRHEPNRLWTTYETGNEPNQIPTFRPFEWSGGGEVRLGRWFGCEPCCPDPCETPCETDCGSPCGCSPCGSPYGSTYGSPYGSPYGGQWGPPGRWGLVATYWALDAMNGYVAQAVPGGSVSTPLIVSDIEFGGVNGTIYFDSAQEHRVWRQSEFRSIELEFLRSPVNPGWYGTVGIDWSVGVRYFRFEDDWTFGSLDIGGTWGGNGGLNEAYFHDNVVNDLLGVQMGFNFDWHVSHNLRLFLVPEFGIYNNHIKHVFEAYRGDGTVANPTAASGMTGTYPVRSSDDVVSFMTQIDLGLEWQFTPRWSAFAGYRVLFATGIALADDQIPTYIVDIPELADIDHNANLVLHGAFAGVTYRF